MRLMRSVTSSGLSVSLVKASQMVGVASASTLAMTGSSTASGRRPRTRETRSRTSAAASSGFFSSLKRTVIWLRSAREIEVMMSTPSMPAIESSSGLVTCDSMTSDDAPVSTVLTVTTGSSMRGYSRSERRLNDTRPTSTISSDITLASTGRRIEVSDSFMRASRGSDGRRGAARRCPRRRRHRCGAARGARRPAGAARLAGIGQIDHAHRQRCRRAAAGPGRP